MLRGRQKIKNTVAEKITIELTIGPIAHVAKSHRLTRALTSCPTAVFSYYQIVLLNVVGKSYSPTPPPPPTVFQQPTGTIVGMFSVNYPV
jgi:hypothetical protein